MSTRAKKSNTTGTATYMYIYNGELRAKVSAETEHSKKRINANGKEVLEERFPNITGRLLAIGVENKILDAGKKMKELQLKFSDVEGIIYLNMDMESKYANQFLNKLPNIDLTKEMIVYPSFFDKTKTEDGKNKYYFTVIQDFTDVPKSGKKISNYFTKENPRELPAPVVFKGTKGDIWDFGRQITFFENMIERIFKIQLLEIQYGKPITVKYEEEAAKIVEEMSVAEQQAKDAVNENVDTKKSTKK